MSTASPRLEPILSPHGPQIIEKLEGGKRRIVRRWRVAVDMIRVPKLGQYVFQPWGTPDGQWSGTDGRTPPQWDVFPEAFLVEQRVIPEDGERNDSRFVEKIYEETPYYRSEGVRTHGGVTYSDVSIVYFQGQTELDSVEGASGGGYVLSSRVSYEFGRAVRTLSVASGEGEISRAVSRDWRDKGTDRWGRITWTIGVLSPQSSGIPGRPSGVPPGAVLVQESSSFQDSGSYRIWNQVWEHMSGTVSVAREERESGQWWTTEHRAWDDFPTDDMLDELYQSGWSRTYERSGWVTNGVIDILVDSKKARKNRSIHSRQDGSLVEEVSILKHGDIPAWAGYINAINKESWEELGDLSPSNLGRAMTVPTGRSVSWRLGGTFLLSVTYIHVPVTRSGGYMHPWIKPGKIEVNNANGTLNMSAPTQVYIKGKMTHFYGTAESISLPTTWYIEKPCQISFTALLEDGQEWAETMTRPGYIGSGAWTAVNGQFMGRSVISAAGSFSSSPASVPSGGIQLMLSGPDEYCANDLDGTVVYTWSYFTADPNSIDW